jgi:glycine/serine hydroxymethyltransferase
MANAQALARGLAGQGLKVCGDPAIGYTETHQVVIDVGYAQGPEVARRLEENNIIVNYQALPWDEGFTASSGLRLGTSEMTRFGMKEKDMETVAGLMAEVIARDKTVKDEVVELRSRFLDLGFCFQDQELESMTQELLETF